MTREGGGDHQIHDHLPPGSDEAHVPALALVRQTSLDNVVFGVGIEFAAAKA
jgi:hypothetical protein